MTRARAGFSYQKELFDIIILATTIFDCKRRENIYELQLNRKKDSRITNQRWSHSKRLGPTPLMLSETSGKY
jgi:hypothetical protein